MTTFSKSCSRFVSSGIDLEIVWALCQKIYDHELGCISKTPPKVDFMDKCASNDPLVVMATPQTEDDLNMCANKIQDTPQIMLTDPIKHKTSIYHMLLINVQIPSITLQNHGHQCGVA
jgi:hypothetical protein